jgi:hypothetical protein
MYQYPYVPSTYHQQSQFQHRAQIQPQSQFQQMAAQSQFQQLLAPPGLPPQPGASVQLPGMAAPVHPQMIASDSVDLVKAAGKPKKGIWCWKCSVTSHAAKDCKVKRYCYICDKQAHPTIRCPVLKMPRPSVFVCGPGLLETYFTAFPDSVIHEDLTPSQTPIALVVVSGDEGTSGGDSQAGSPTLLSQSQLEMGRGASCGYAVSGFCAFL